MDILDSFMNAGDDIMNTVSDAAKSGDFSHLSEDIRRAVKQAEMDIKGAAGSASGAAARYSAEQRTDRSGAQRQGVNCPRGARLLCCRTGGRRRRTSHSRSGTGRNFLCFLSDVPQEQRSLEARENLLSVRQ